MFGLSEMREDELEYSRRLDWRGECRDGDQGEFESLVWLEQSFARGRSFFSVLLLKPHLTKPIQKALSH